MTMTHEPTYPAALNALTDLIQNGFENPKGVSGQVQMNVRDGERAFPLGIRFDSNDLDIQHAKLDRPDADMTLPLQTVERIVNSTTNIDFRDSEIASTVHLDGDLGLISHIASTLLRPTEGTRNRFRSAEELDTDAYSLTEIPRISRPSEKTILESLMAGRPMIVTDLDMPESHSEWSLERLESEYGDVPLRAVSAGHQETVAEFLTRVRAVDLESGLINEGQPKAYTEGCSLPEPLHKDFLPNYFTREDFIDPQIWLGSVPVDVAATDLHRDPLDGFLYQVMGRKRFRMYAPDQAPFVYPMKAYNNYQLCWVKPEAPDDQQFPEFSKARGLDTVLYPGELLIQPAGWFHAVYCLDSPTFSVSYFLKYKNLNELVKRIQEDGASRSS